METSSKAALTKYGNILHIDASGPIATGQTESITKQQQDFFDQHTNHSGAAGAAGANESDSDLSEESELEEDEDGDEEEPSSLNTKETMEVKTSDSCESGSSVSNLPPPEQSVESSVVKPDEKLIEKKPIVAKDKFKGEPTVSSQMFKSVEYKPLMGTKKLTTNKKGVSFRLYWMQL